MGIPAAIRLRCPWLHHLHTCRHEALVTVLLIGFRGRGFAFYCGTTSWLGCQRATGRAHYHFLGTYWGPKISNLLRRPRSVLKWLQPPRRFAVQLLEATLRRIFGWAEYCRGLNNYIVISWSHIPPRPPKVPKKGVLPSLFGGTRCFCMSLSGFS